MANDFCLVLCTCPDADSAGKLAHALVESRLAACVNIVPGMTSVYGWQDQIETAQEHLLLIKTARAAETFVKLETLIKAHHPYEVPEIIAIPIEQGSADYLAWIKIWLEKRK